MKVKNIIPVVIISLLLAAPQADAQNRRVERKLNREMRKLEKQRQKVQKIKAELDIPYFQEFEIMKEKQFKKALEMKELQNQLTREQRESARQYERLAQQGAREAREKARLYQLETRKEFKEQHRKMLEESRSLERIHHRHLDEIYEHLPDLDEIYECLPDLDEIFECLPDLDDIDINIPDIHFPDIDIPDLDLRMSTVYESDNSLIINKKFEDENLSKDYSYTVAGEAASLNISISGSVEKGTFKIVLLSPDGKEYQSFEITPMADVKWNQQLSIGKEDSTNTGKWTISVDAREATGKFNIRMRSR